MPADTKDTSASHHSTARARLFAGVALTLFATAVAYLGREGYRAATDSFVAPMILSPESDVVLQTKAKMGELEIERGRIISEAEAIDADLEASTVALTQLRELKTLMASALEWTKSVTGQQAAVSSHDLKALSEQRVLLAAMASKQARIAKEADGNLAASLISKTDLAKEELALEQVQLALLENDRTRMQQTAALNQAFFAQSSLSHAHRTVMPEEIARQEQTVRISLEIARLESEQRAKRYEKKVVLAKLAKMDEIEAQLKGRPLFRATEKPIEVAFVPYTQIDGVGNRAVVYDLSLIHI